MRSLESCVTLPRGPGLPSALASEDVPMPDNSLATTDPVCLAVLVDPESAPAVDAMRMALVSLAAAGYIAIDTAPGGDSFLHVRHAPAVGSPAHLVAVYRVLSGAAVQGRLSRVATQQSLSKAFGGRFKRYVKSYVDSALVAQGLLQIKLERFLWVFTVRHKLRTVTGTRLGKRLSRQLSTLDILPRLIKDDPLRALQLARAAGPFLLLSPAAREALPRLRKLAPALPALALDSAFEQREPAWLELFEQMEMLMTIDFDTLFATIEAVAEIGGEGLFGSSSDSDGGGDGGGD